MTSQYSLVEQFNIIIKGTVTDGRFPSSFALRTAIKPQASLRSCHGSVPHVLRLCLGCHQSLWPHGCSSLFRAPIFSGFTPLLEEANTRLLEYLWYSGMLTVPTSILDWLQNSQVRMGALERTDCLGVPSGAQRLAKGWVNPCTFPWKLGKWCPLPLRVLWG